MTNKLSTKLEYVYHLYLNIMTKIVKYRIGKWILRIRSWDIRSTFSHPAAFDPYMMTILCTTQCPIRRGSGQILGCGFLGLNPLLSGPRNGFWSIFGHLIEFGLVAQLSKQPQNGFYKVNQDMGRKFKTARVGTPLHGIGSVKSTVLIRENPQFMWPA